MTTTTTETIEAVVTTMRTTKLASTINNCINIVSGLCGRLFNNNNFKEFNILGCIIKNVLKIKFLACKTIIREKIMLIKREQKFVTLRVIVMGTV